MPCRSGTVSYSDGRAKGHDANKKCCSSVCVCRFKAIYLCYFCCFVAAVCFFFSFFSGNLYQKRCTNVFCCQLVWKISFSRFTWLLCMITQKKRNQFWVVLSCSYVGSVDATSCFKMSVFTSITRNVAFTCSFLYIIIYRDMPLVTGVARNLFHSLTILLPMALPRYTWCAVLHSVARLKSPIFFLVCQVY